MVAPILFFAAAGALAGAGAGGSVYLWRRGSQEAAKLEQQRDIENIKELLQQHTDLATIRAEAEAAGVDVDAAIAGYEAVKNGYMDLEEALRQYYAGEAAVPAKNRRAASELSAGGSPAIEAPSSEIRDWARSNGHEVADFGPIPKDVLSAYRRAHG